MLGTERLTKKELLSITTKMRNAANITYALLVGTGVHPFIEFNGMMQKFVDLCAREAGKGRDFTMNNVHTGNPMPLEDHDVLYLAEKFNCIFGDTLRANPRQWALFKKVIEQR